MAEPSMGPRLLSRGNFSDSLKITQQNPTSMGPRLSYRAIRGLRSRRNVSGMNIAEIDPVLTQSIQQALHLRPVLAEHPSSFAKPRRVIQLGNRHVQFCLGEIQRVRTTDNREFQCQTRVVIMK